MLYIQLLDCSHTQKNMKIIKLSVVHDQLMWFITSLSMWLDCMYPFSKITYMLNPSPFLQSSSSEVSERLYPGLQHSVNLHINQTHKLSSCVFLFVNTKKQFVLLLQYYLVFKLFCPMYTMNLSLANLASNSQITALMQIQFDQHSLDTVLIMSLSSRSSWYTGEDRHTKGT